VYFWPISLYITCCQFASQEAFACLQPCCPVGRCLLLTYSHKLFYASVYVVGVGGVGEATGVGILAGISRVRLVGGGFCLWV
jgi:hypothetical protein